MSIIRATMGMDGAGYYDEHSGTQMTGIEALRRWIDDAVAGLPLPALANDSCLDLVAFGRAERALYGRSIRLQASAGHFRVTPLPSLVSRAGRRGPTSFPS